VYSDADASLGGTSATGGTAGSAGTTGTGATGGVGGTAGTGGQAGGDAGKSCTTAADCDNENPCDGVETCPSGTCAAGTPLADNTPCAVGDGGTSDASHQTVCISGACVATCTQDADCDDGDACTGLESCSSSGVCQTGTPLKCDDNNACTSNECDKENGCFYPLIDADGDGHAPDSLGSCGDDCDDTDKTVYGGAQELCDNKDNNCNGQKDELAPTWYSDCDADGFAPAGAPSVTQCTKPSAPDTSCGSGGAWISVAPGTGTTDCWDKDAKAHPYTAAANNTAWQTTAIIGAPTTIDFDYNCDNVEEKRFTTVKVPLTATCSWQGSGTYKYCTGAAGWTGTVIPECGKSAQYTSCSVLLGCSRTTSTPTQGCR